MQAAFEILGGTLVVLAVTVMVYWLGWLQPPSPAAVCRNVERVVAQSRGTTAAARERAACIDTALHPPVRGRAIWVRRLECRRDAHDLAALQGCDTLAAL